MCLPKGNRMRCVFLLCLFLTTVQGCGVNWPFGSSTQTKRGPPKVPDSRNEDVPKQVTNKGVVITLRIKNDKDMVRDALVGEIIVGNYNHLNLHMDITSPMVILPTKHASGFVYHRTKDGTRYTYKTYSSDESQTYSSTGESQTTPLTNFEVTGVYATEQFMFNGEGSRRIVIKNQEFLEANKVRKEFLVYDGVFGLALMTGDKRSKAAPVHNMVEQFTEPVFGIHVSRQNLNDVACLILGGGDEKFYKTETLHSHAVRPTPNERYERYDGWYIMVQRVQIQTKTGERFEISSSVREAIPAPDVEYVLLPEEIKNKFFERVSDSVPTVGGGKAVPCDDVWGRQPKLVLSIDGQEYTLTAEEYLIKYRKTEDGLCVLGIDSHPNVLHLGRVFMKKFYTRFDVKNRQVQFAESKVQP